MRGLVLAPTVAALLFAVVLATLMSMLLAELSLAQALGTGVLLAVLVVAAASNEMALYLLIFSMLLGPEFVAGGLGEGTTLGRGLTFRLDDLLILIVGVAWLAKTALHHELGLIFRTPLNWPIAAYACTAVFATGLGIIAGRVAILSGSLFVLKYIQYFVIYFMVLNHLRERRQFARFLVALLATAAIASVIGILQIPSGARVAAPFEGTQGEPNTFGGYLVLMLALIGGLYVAGLRQKLPLLLLAGLIFVPLLFTFSRATYLALICMSAALVAWSQQRLILASLVALGLVLSPFLLPQRVVDRVLYTVTQPEERGQVEIAGVRLDTSTSDRLRSWDQAVLADWPDHPLFGYGVTGYRFLDSQYPRVLTETGLVGLVAFLWLQVSLFRRAFAVFQAAKDPLYRGVALGFLGGLGALVGHSIGANTFVIVRIMEPFWFLAGMVMMIPSLESGQAAWIPAAEPRPRRGAVRRATTAAPGLWGSAPTRGA